MTGPRTVETHIVPRISAAAAGRPGPRVCVALPIAVTADVDDARRRAARIFQMYGHLPNYRRVDREGMSGPEDVAIFGGEREVEAAVRALAAVGATDFLAVMFPAEDDARESIARTHAFLKDLIGRVAQNCGKNLGAPSQLDDEVFEAGDRPTMPRRPAQGVFLRTRETYIISVASGASYVTRKIALPGSFRRRGLSRPIPHRWYSAWTGGPTLDPVSFFTPYFLTVADNAVRKTR